MSRYNFRSIVVLCRSNSAETDTKLNKQSGIWELNKLITYFRNSRKFPYSREKQRHDGSGSMIDRTNYSNKGENMTAENQKSVGLYSLNSLSVSEKWKIYIYSKCIIHIHNVFRRRQISSKCKRSLIKNSDTPYKKNVLLQLIFQDRFFQVR